jgi:hypothetical protein
MLLKWELHFAILEKVKSIFFCNKCNVLKEVKLHFILFFCLLQESYVWIDVMTFLQFIISNLVIN